jgi:DNA primase
VRFPEHFINQVAQATDVVDLIGQYVALKKRGKEFVGLCPFHDDKRPSLNVSPSKQIFKCFACGTGGGVFQFLMQYEKLEFPQAVRALAERAHIPLPAETAAPEPKGLGRADLIALMTFAARYYRSQLRSAAGADALRYALGRGLNESSIDRFGIGYAPDSWDALLRAALAEGYGEEQLVAAGLVARREERPGCYDRFRNRLIFPILGPAGEVIAFGGRALAAEEQAKYLNSPDTPIFDKSAQLYALNWARQPIAASGTAIVVEGYLDALMPIQSGVGNVVATMGTALTDRHVRLLARYAKEAVLVFDADTAGSAAAERALEIFLA